VDICFAFMKHDGYQVLTLSRPLSSPYLAPIWPLSSPYLIDPDGYQVLTLSIPRCLPRCPHRHRRC